MWRKGLKYHGLDIPPMWHAFHIDGVLVQRRPRGWCYKNTNGWICFAQGDSCIAQVMDRMEG